jgi:CheY-like chemotaxis protein
MIRLLVCDDSAEVRAGLRATLAGQAEIEIIAEAANGEEAISLAAARAPDVVLIDVAMPVLNGFAATRQIRELLPTVRIVAFACSDDTEVGTAMVEAGANDYCVKAAPLWELERAIAGASDPLVRLAHLLPRSVKGGGTGELVARELADLTGASFAAAYLATRDAGLSLAGMAGPAAPSCPAAAPAVVARSFSERALAWGDAHELAELCSLGVRCAEALAVPLVANGEALGALLVAMPANVQIKADAEFVSAVADLAAASVANKGRLALSFAESAA